MVKRGAKIEIPLAIVLGRDVEVDEEILVSFLTAAAYSGLGQALAALIEGRINISGEPPRPPSRVLRV